MTRKPQHASVGSDGINGEYFEFGKHRYHYVRWVALNDSSYLRWILQEDFPESVKRSCRDAVKWASQGAPQWSGPNRAEGAAKRAAEQFAADVDRIWKD